MLSHENIQILKDEFNYTMSPKTLALLEKWHDEFLAYNEHTNLMSAGDVKNIFPKHIFDSLAILKWGDFDPTKKQKILDVGTGGGFPSVILAICFPELEIVANDSRIKKINFIIDIKDKLNLKNLKISYARVEDLEPLECDIVLSRAVGKILNVWRISKKHLKENGHFVIYKSKTLNEELETFLNFNKTMTKDDIEIIPYDLPLCEEFERYLAIIKQ